MMHVLGMHPSALLLSGATKLFSSRPAWHRNAARHAGWDRVVCDISPVAGSPALSYFMHNIIPGSI